MARATKIDPVVPDASIIVKWYIEEEYSAQARTLREDYLNGLIEIMVPSLVAYEVVNALRYSLEVWGVHPDETGSHRHGPGN